MTYKRTAGWLNNRGYETLRGRQFRKNNTLSIIKKKRLNKGRFLKSFLTEVS
jgi:hypothetical protein